MKRPKLNKEIAKLKDLNREQFAAMDKYDDQLNAANKQIAELKEYTRHKLNCARYDVDQPDIPCQCGLNELLNKY